MKKSKQPCRFVVLWHEGHGATHFDLMIEAGATLSTWQFESAPTLLAPGGALACRRLADHRIAYLDYEGPVSGGRGWVVREDGGTCNIISATDARWQVEMRGTTMRGSYTFARRGPDWSLAREKM